jgi:lactate dehydrogenase-like 2-hydroxyacid dehydrogenase
VVRPGILFLSDFLIDRLGPLPVDAEIFTAADVADGVTEVVSGAVEIVVSAGSLANSLVDALPRLKLVACFSTGYAGIDLRHLRARGIALTTGGGVNAHDVADHALALFLGLWHGIPAGDQLVRAGGWREGVRARPSLRGRRAGVVGLGRIGEAIATRLAAHGMEVRWWGPRAKPGVPFAQADSLVALAEWSDALFVASRALPENAGQIDASVLRALGPHGVIVNVSRGMLIDEDALIAALNDKTIGGAGLDVFGEEPPPASRWRNLSNVLLSPHLAGFTREGGEDLIGQLRENILRYFRGEPLLTPVEDIV